MIFRDRDPSCDRQAFGVFLLGLFIVFYLLTQLTGCRHNPMPQMDVSFWAGDSEKNGISRSQESKTLKCDNPEFDQYTCISYGDVQKIMNVLLSCQKWPDTVTLVKANTLLRTFSQRNPEVMTHVRKPRNRKYPREELDEFVSSSVTHTSEY